ncbi:hypothetical protein, partial [Shewanella sp.]|uniref:hypothetical protein n=1 Tax=Shewanella sp. TaxID=50422 RepID=UPI004048DF44
GIWSDNNTAAWPAGARNSGNNVELEGATWNNYFVNPNIANPYNSGPTPDQYGRLPSTAVSKTVNLGRISYRVSIPGENVIIDTNPTPIVGGYTTFNFPSAIFCPKPRTTFAEAEADRLLFENNKEDYNRNGITYGPYIFGGCLPDVLDNIYTYVELRASTPFQDSNGDWYINYTTHAYKTSVGNVVEIITGFNHNPAHSVLLRYNITTNSWVGDLANIDEAIFTNAGSYQYTNKKLTLQSVSPSSTRQWNGFSNLSNTTVNLIEFFVDVDTNIGSSSTPTQSEVEVATTKSNGGGKPDRYPLIMTNLFNRNRSIYSIGMTHKDTWDLFL